MNKKTFLIASSVSACALVAGAIGIGAGTNFARVTAEMLAHDGVASGAYQLVLDKNATKIDETTYSVASKDGNAITFKTTAALGASETGLGTLAVGESIYNETPIGSIAGGWITDNLNNKDKSYSFEFGYNFGTEKAPVVKYVSNAESNGVIASNNLKDYRPSYVKFTAKEEVDLTNLVLNYHCDDTRHNVPDDFKRDIVLKREAGEVQVPLYAAEDSVATLQYKLEIELTAGETIEFVVKDGKAPLAIFDTSALTAFYKGNLLQLGENKILVRDTGTYTFYLKFNDASWVSAVTKTSHMYNTYYVKDNSNWSQGNAEVHGYFFGAGGDQWVKGTKLDVEGTTYWSFTKPDIDVDKVIYLRKKPGAGFDWDNNPDNNKNETWNRAKEIDLCNAKGNVFALGAGQWGEKYNDVSKQANGTIEVYVPIGADVSTL